MLRSRLVLAIGTVLGVSALAMAYATAQERKMSTDTPKDMVAAYDSLATGILAMKHTEANLIRSMLATTYAHAELAARLSHQAMAANQKSAAATHLEALATLVAQLGTEGDSAVAAIRKRLLEGGHHHNAEGEKQGVYDPGFVIVTRSAKQVFLDASKAIGQMARSPDSSALDREWAKVQKAYDGLMKAEK